MDMSRFQNAIKIKFPTPPQTQADIDTLIDYFMRTLNVTDITFEKEQDYWTLVLFFPTQAEALQYAAALLQSKGLVVN